MSEYEQIIDEIVKHGVVVKVNKIVDDNYIPYERKYVGCVVELDFSEHDKVFEDRIEELEKRIQELDIIDAMRFDEKRELKQRIAELESRETKKPINGWICVAAKEINGQEYVKLEDFLQVVNDLQAEIGT